ncbi:MAG: cytochrome D ubiquinol oxidase subunit I [Alphaproteobacteria bacterium]|nr:cytochrome D ubiquinol oxidase subunit I [Alphaproteobacteria bacterium]
MTQEPKLDLDSRSSLSLDPEDWDAFRLVAHRTLDHALDYLAKVRERPVWQPVPAGVKRELAMPPPLRGRGIDAATADACRLILPYATGNTHPGFCGWVHGGGTTGGIMAEMLAAAMNANLGGREHAPVYVERQVVSWFKEIFGFPTGASGLLTSGTSMATLNALAIARNAKAAWDVRTDGVASGKTRLTCYASSEAHGSVQKALEILGLGGDALRSIPVDSDRRISVPDLRSAIEADRASGCLPICVVGTAGTVNTGAIDDLNALADTCKEYDLWFHVDGAFGALAMLAPGMRHLVAGIERADSLAFDFHKWMQVPYDAGCLLIRDEASHLATFGGRQTYLAGAKRGLAAGGRWYCEYGPELSRGFRALKIWMTIQEHGMERLGHIVANHCRIAASTAALVNRKAELELLAPQFLNIVCLRYVDADLPEDTLNRLNQKIVETLHEEGIAAPSTCRIDGILAIRACFSNHRTEQSDADYMIDQIVRLGRMEGHLMMHDGSGRSNARIV